MPLTLDLSFFQPYVQVNSETDFAKQSRTNYRRVKKLIYCLTSLASFWDEKGFFTIIQISGEVMDDTIPCTIIFFSKQFTTILHQILQKRLYEEIYPKDQNPFPFPVSCIGQDSRQEKRDAGSQLVRQHTHAHKLQCTGLLVPATAAHARGALLVLCTTAAPRLGLVIEIGEKFREN